MSIPVNVQAKTAAILEKEALFYGVNAAAVAKAILDTVAKEGLTHTILGGIDVESFHLRKRGRPRVKTGKRD